MHSGNAQPQACDAYMCCGFRAQCTVHRSVMRACAGHASRVPYSHKVIYNLKPISRARAQARKRTQKPLTSCT
eukprot:10770660-Alexandrium_andersonii.AAC.1